MLQGLWWINAHVRQKCKFFRFGTYTWFCRTNSYRIRSSKKINKQKGVVVGFIGDGAAEEGGFYETINLASVLKVPLMIVIEDNKLAVETTQEVRKPKKYNLEKIIKGYGAIYSKVNGQDFIKVYESTKKLKSKILKKNCGNTSCRSK